MKHRILLVALGFLAVFLVNAYSTGVATGRSGAPTEVTCAESCHSGTGNVGSVNFTSDIPNDGYIPGETYNITISGSTEQGQRYGFQLSSRNELNQQVGELVAGDGAKVTSTGYLTHRFPDYGSKGEWSFQWVAPISGTGTVTFYSAMVAANGNGSDTGDAGLVGSFSASENVLSSVSSVVDKPIKLYPTVVTDHVWVENGNDKLLRLFSSDGRLITEQQIIGDKVIVPLELNTGYYFVELSDKSFPILSR